MTSSSIFGNVVIDALFIIFLLFLPKIIGSIISNIITYYYVNHRYNVQSNKYTAKELLDRYIYDNHLDVIVRLTKGSLTDYYMPGNDYIYLSEAVYHSRSLLSISVAFHEMGHAMAFKSRDISHRMSMVLSPFINWIAKILILGVFFLSIGVFDYPITYWIVGISMILFILISWSLIKSEWMASKFALGILEGLNIQGEDIKKCKVLLRCCWLTYVFYLLSVLSITGLMLLASAGSGTKRKV